MTKWIPIQRFEINVRDYLEQGFHMLQNESGQNNFQKVPKMDDNVVGLQSSCIKEQASNKLSALKSLRKKPWDF